MTDKERLNYHLDKLAEAEDEIVRLDPDDYRFEPAWERRRIHAGIVRELLTEVQRV